MTATNQPVEKDPKSGLPMLMAQRQEYIAQRNTYIAAAQDSVKSLDQAMIVLSGTLLTLSITFFDKFIGQATAQSPTFLGSAWFCLLASLVATLAAFYTSQAAWKKHLDVYDDYYRTGERPTNIENRPAMLTNTLNIAAIVLFLIGVVCLIVFVLSNLPTMVLPTNNSPTS